MQFCGYQQWLMIASKQRQEDREGVSVSSLLSLSGCSTVMICVTCTWLQVVCKALYVIWWSQFLKLVSSTKSWWLTEWFAMMSEKGVVYKTNSSGPSTEPCGTPNGGGQEEAELLTTTHCALSRRYDQNHWSVVEWMPKTVFKWERRIWWLTILNAAERSSKGRTQILSSSIVFSKSFKTHGRAVLVLCPAQQAEWKGLQRLFSWGCARVCVEQPFQGF